MGVETFLLQELGDSLREKGDLLIDSLLAALAGFGCSSGDDDLRFHPMFNRSLSLKSHVKKKIQTDVFKLILNRLYSSNYIKNNYQSDKETYNNKTTLFLVVYQNPVSRLPRQLTGMKIDQ